MNPRHALPLALAVVAALACSRGVASPATLDPRNDACANCRMAVSDAQFAAQLVAPGEEPRFFDDVGCLRDHLTAARLAAGAVAYVADHRTRAWVRADLALYTRTEAVQTPMGSQLIAHADAASRDADPAAGGGRPVPVAEIFGPAGPPAGGKGGR